MNRFLGLLREQCAVLERKLENAAPQLDKAGTSTRVRVEAQGYAEQRWWTQTGWEWRRGRWDSRVEESWLRD
jgi:hypothetical protein